MNNDKEDGVKGKAQQVDYAVLFTTESWKRTGQHSSIQRSRIEVHETRNRRKNPNIRHVWIHKCKRRTDDSVSILLRR